LDLGGETRQVFAGIKSAYKPEDLEGKLTVMVCPKEWYLQQARGGGEDLWILNPDDGAQPGMKVK